MVEAGYKPEDITVRVDRDQAKMYGEEYAAEISGLKQYKDNIYYVEVKYPNGEAIMPISEGRHQCDTMLALVFPNYQTGWNADNDYSNADLLDGESVVTDKITVYQDGVLIYGTEPDGTTPSETTEPSDKILEGDVNVDGSVTLADLTALNKYLVKKSQLKAQALANADMNKDNAVNIFDSVELRKKLMK